MSNNQNTRSNIMDAQPAAEEGIPPAAEAEPEPETEEVGEQLDRDGSVPSTTAVEATSGWLRAESRAPATDDALHQQATSLQRLGGLSRSQAGVHLINVCAKPAAGAKGGTRLYASSLS
eukprot:COSAG06_NODE_10325_length_1701_cov_91.127965_2_plen_119_part_00